MGKQRPDWLKVKLKATDEFAQVQVMLEKLSLHTVCQQASCPNMGECFGRSTATFMILGRVCTRNCSFCAVGKGQPLAVDPNEPANVALAVSQLKLRHVVVTSVTRDDLPHGGAEHFVDVIESIRKMDGKIVIEVLIPDFQGDKTAIAKVVQAKPAIINHNVETVPSLYAGVRPMANYRRSLDLLQQVKLLDNTILTKSGIMLGLGEKGPEVIAVLEDLRKIDCDLVTIGQYLAPSEKHYPVVEYIQPEEFARYKEIALALGFKHVSSGPLVRSSYHAQDSIKSV
jgi:lipoyl synthase